MSHPSTPHGGSLLPSLLGYGELTLATCPRASLAAPPRPFKM